MTGEALRDIGNDLRSDILRYIHRVDTLIRYVGILTEEYEKVQNQLNVALPPISDDSNASASGSST